MAEAHDDGEADLTGTVIAGRFRITGRLGAGAMGTVYRAEHVELGTPLAIKMLRAHLGASDEAGARFRREAFVGARIAHPNCVEVLDFGTTDDGSFYLAMELLDGEPLAAVLEREGRLPWRRALRIARHVLAGLEHAHGESVVHRDIKPDNVFVARRGDDPDFARILDFGIAKLVGDAGQQAITKAGIAIGTPSYLSPEQATGGALDGRCDLYSTSVVLFEMLTGKTPFGDREPLKILFAHAGEPPPTFAEIAPDLEVPPGLEALVRDGLAKSPADRIGSAAEYIRRIDALLPAPAAAPTPPAPRRRGKLAFAIVAVALAAGIAGVVALGGGGASSSPADAAAPPPVPTEVVAAIGKLEHGATCAARKQAVKALRALGHPAAIPPLERARSRPHKGKNANACLVAAAEAAIAELTAARDRP